jgi:imidazolonepropionase-like amidohydrolase
VPQRILVEDATVIDGTDAAPRPHTSILIANGHIVTVGPAARMRTPDTGVVRVNASGKFVIPGLWDMHTHTLRPDRRDYFLPLFIANGVTGTRDMGAGDLSLRGEWRRAIATGTLVGPRIIGTGAILDGPLPLIPGSFTAETAEDGARQVRMIRESGADFVKVYSLLPEPALRGALSEAARLRIPVVGHVSEYVDAATASTLGQQSFEHLLGVLVSISSREDSLRARILDATRSRDRAAFAAARLAAYVEAAQTIDTTKARALFALLARNGTWQVPTLTYWAGLTRDPASEAAADSFSRYLPESVTRGWQSQLAALQSRKDAYRIVASAHRWILSEMRRAGVRIMAGTDALAIGCLPGFGLHDELELLVSAGLSPLEAIQSATRNVAEFLSARDSLGTVEAGRVADLVVLDANPLADIRNARRIGAVVAAGRLYDRASIEQLRADVLTALRSAK